ncbi:MAG: DUF1294 domain-containing protein [Mycoplasmatales bacterium]
MIKYLLLINLITFILFYTDKYNAMHMLYRIPEKILYLFILIGGFGSILFMYLLNHKINKISFKIVPSISIIIWILIIYNYWIIIMVIIWIFCIKNH